MSKMIQIQEFEQNIEKSHLVMGRTNRWSALMIELGKIEYWEARIRALRLSNEVEIVIPSMPICLCGLITDYVIT